MGLFHHKAPSYEVEALDADIRRSFLNDYQKAVMQYFNGNRDHLGLSEKDIEEMRDVLRGGKSPRFDKHQAELRKDANSTSIFEIFKDNRSFEERQASGLRMLDAAMERELKRRKGSETAV
jgi:hypothetical protein